MIKNVSKWDIMLCPEYKWRNITTFSTIKLSPAASAVINPFDRSDNGGRCQVYTYSQMLFIQVLLIPPLTFFL